MKKVPTTGSRQLSGLYIYTYTFIILGDDFESEDHKDPGDLHDEPGDLHNEPGDLLNEPGDLHNEPGDLHNEPGDLHNEPGEIHKEPGELHDVDYQELFNTRDKKKEKTNLQR